MKIKLLVLIVFIKDYIFLFFNNLSLNNIMWYLIFIIFKLDIKLDFIKLLNTFMIYVFIIKILSNLKLKF